MHLFSPTDRDVSLSGQRRRFLPVLALLVATLLMCAGFLFTPSSQLHHAKADSWTQIWSDNFDGAAGGVDTSNWIYDTGTGWGTGEIENMTSSTDNVQRDGNGHLKITALRDGNGNWTSGRIESQRSDFAAPAGGQLEVSASIQQPNVSGDAAAGYWPAFWMLGSQFRVDHNWPNDGEIDIMEDINGRSSVFGTLHCGVDPGGPCNETTGIGSGERSCPGCQTDFHTYSMILDRSVSPEQIRWYLDGNNYFTVSANQVPASTWSAAVDHGFFIIFDLAMGGGFPAAFGGGPTSATQSGASMLVDNVEVSVTGDSSGGGGGGTPTPTPNSDGFTPGASNVGGNQTQFTFQPSGWSAGYVILHYVAAGQTQQNVYMTYNSGSSRWEYTAGGINSGSNVSYSFTYQKDGLQYDSGWYTWTQ